MQRTIERYVYKIYATTFLSGLLLGTIVLYVKDKYTGAYNNDWDNPFYDFIFFFIVGIGESIIPLLLFYLFTILIIKLKMPSICVYLLGVACALAPFGQLYFMVNEGYHRTNVVIYALCFLSSLIVSYWLFRRELKVLREPVSNSGIL